jgi:DNA topoisomerase I
VQVFEELASIFEDKLFPEREDGGDRRACPACKDGRLYLNGSSRGAFVACSNYRRKGDEQCTYIRNFTGEERTGEEWTIGEHPEHKETIYLKQGMYGR